MSGQRAPKGHKACKMYEAAKWARLHPKRDTLMTEHRKGAPSPAGRPQPPTGMVAHCGRSPSSRRPLPSFPPSTGTLPSFSHRPSDQLHCGERPHPPLAARQHHFVVACCVGRLGLSSPPKDIKNMPHTWLKKKVHGSLQKAHILPPNLRQQQFVRRHQS